MIVVGTSLVERHFQTHAGHKGLKAAKAQYESWLSIVKQAEWRGPDDMKRAHAKASILKGGRAVFNIKANDFRLVAAVDYLGAVVRVRFFGTHAEYDEIDAETV